MLGIFVSCFRRSPDFARDLEADILTCYWPIYASHATVDSMNPLVSAPMMTTETHVTETHVSHEEARGQAMYAFVSNS